MLSDTARPVIEATLPVVAAHLDEITPKFYARMFAARPELLDGIFSRANQRNGTQQKALAGSIASFASHLVEHPDALPEKVLSRIAHKHTSLGIVEEQYPIVYEHLFAAIAEVLGDAAERELVGRSQERGIDAREFVDDERMCGPQRVRSAPSLMALHAG